MEKIHPVLLSSPLFSGIAPEDLTGLLHCLGGRTLFVPKGGTVLSEGSEANDMGIVLSGGVQMIRDDYYGNRSIVAHMGQGELFAESYACAGIPELPISVVATQDSQILLLEARRVTKTCCNACAFHNRIIFNLLQLVAEKNLVFHRKIHVTAQRTTREKLMAYLLGEAKARGTNRFTIPYDRQALADYLDVDRSGLSTEIGKLRKEGVLECHRSTFTLL